MRILGLLVIASMTVAGTSVVTAAPAQAAAFAVTTTADTNDGSCTPALCSLRDAVIAANANPGADTISLPSGTYTLTRTGRDEDAAATGDLDITGGLTIVGTGAPVINGNRTDRVIETFAGGGVHLELVGVDVASGDTHGSTSKDGAGIAIRAGNSLDMAGGAVRDSVGTGNGGGIYAEGDVHLDGTAVTGNWADGFGGGIYNLGAQGSGRLAVTNGSSVSSNISRLGGGLYLENEAELPVRIVDSTVEDNATTPTPAGPEHGNGAGIYALTDGEVIVSRTDLASNNAELAGGAIYVQDQPGGGTPTVSIDHSRLRENRSPGGAGVTLGTGGGTITAEKNWWSCNAGPNTSFCDTAQAGIDTDPWIVLTHTASPAAIKPGQSTTLTADFRHNTDGSTNDPAELGAFAGLPALFRNPQLGTISNAQATYQANGAATATFTAGGTDGTGHADAFGDNEIVTADIPIDSVAPSVPAITGKPSNPSNVSRPTFTFGSTDSGSGVASYTCRFEGLPSFACSSPFTPTTPLNDGPHQFFVRATDAAGNSSADASYFWVLDTGKPDTRLDIHPDAVTNQTFTALSFVGSDDSGSLDHFECRLDAPVFTTCDSPIFTDLAEGTHHFEVRAVDRAGNVDDTPASWDWRIDLTAPTVTIAAAPGQADPADQGPIHFRAVFSESVTGFATGDVTLSGGAGASIAAVTEVAPPDGTTYDVAVSGMTQAGAVTASIGAAAAQDLAGNDNTASGTATVAFDPNHAPTAMADSYTVAEDTVLSVAAPGVLGNDTDPDPGDPLSAVLVAGPAHGNLTLLPNGSFTYTPAADYAGPDSFTYRIRDSHGVEAGPVTVSLTVSPADDAPVVVSVRGGSCQQGSTASIRFEVSDPDTTPSGVQITGTSSEPRIVEVVGFGGTTARRTASVRGSLPGAATLTFSVSDGTSTVQVTVGYRAGGSGDDVLTGTSDADILIGRGGDDRINGKGGNDLVCGGGGNDRLIGRVGDDVLDGRAGDDVLRGGADEDAMRGGTGDDRMVGGPAADRFVLGPGRDVLADFSAAQGDTKEQPSR